MPVTIPSTARLPPLREEQEAYGAGREAPPAERRGGVCVWALRCEDF